MHYVNLHYSISCKVSDIYLDAYRSLTVYIGYNHSSNNRQSYNRTSKCARQTAFIPVIRGSMDKFLHLQNKPKIHFNSNKKIAYVRCLTFNFQMFYIK